MAVDAFKIILLTARSRNGETEFQPYTEAAKVRTPPITQRNKDTPTEPVAAKILDGVEKTSSRVSTRETV